MSRLQRRLMDKKAVFGQFSFCSFFCSIIIKIWNPWNPLICKWISFQEKKGKKGFHFFGFQKAFYILKIYVRLLTLFAFQIPGAAGGGPTNSLKSGSSPESPKRPSPNSPRRPPMNRQRSFVSNKEFSSPNFKRRSKTQTQIDFKPRSRTTSSTYCEGNISTSPNTPTLVLNPQAKEFVMKKEVGAYCCLLLLIFSTQK